MKQIFLYLSKNLQNSIDNRIQLKLFFEVVWTILDLDEREEGVSASVVLRQGEHEETGTSVRDWTDNREMDIKIAAGDAFMKAGAAFTGFTPPWGILTGVRPAKVATEIMESGKTPEEAAQIIVRDYE